MQALKKDAIPQKDGIYHVFCPRYQVPALVRLSMSEPIGSQIKVCTVRGQPCDEACIGSAIALR